MPMSIKRAILLLLPLTVLMLMPPVSLARAGELATAFAKHDAASTASIDHGLWDELLQSYVKPASDGVNRVDYAAFKAGGRGKLGAYLDMLQKVDVGALGRAEQFAFWANLYNAKTIDIVLDHYPVASIKKISLGGSLLSSFTGGPWDAKVVEVAGRRLSLNDIEHEIMRPIFGDPRIHYAVNCASIGCPNLGTSAFTGAKLEGQLDAAARAYVNHPRGCTVAGTRVDVSSIYKWYAEDFGGTESGVIAHLKTYAEPELATLLAAAKTISSYDYDWALNDIAR